uniref:Cytochrome c oxidase subunit 3 n=1 Tax=Pyropia dentata TaxID=76160 RepID=A0A8J9WV81_PYRDN|nr:cytochrome c oxidase subunit 3 [Neoporphyra dentata]WKD83568.1 cytochrome c oxidase subunit 3 [Neoporphyra dentata]BDB33257.1 cytochrome c oxidase subunit 3 [Neoporphyra dentata]
MTNITNLSFIKTAKQLQRHPFHLVDPSPWPVTAAIAAFSCALGGVMYMHAYNNGGYLLLSGFSLLFFTMFSWWRDVTREATFSGHHTGAVQKGLRYGVLLFIVSEVLFFFAFFWAFFHSSLAPSIDIGSMWPPKGIVVFSPWEVPFLNTIILLLSGCSVTWAHHSIVAGYKKQATISLVITIVLATIFTGFQGFEYSVANFTLSDGVYGSTFYMATGFHGFHVFIGTVFLSICLFRLLKSHLTQQHHFGFEAAAWYWHFVDVVWLFLFISIYWWGGT